MPCRNVRRVVAGTALRPLFGSCWSTLSSLAMTFPPVGVQNALLNQFGRMPSYRRGQHVSGLGQIEPPQPIVQWLGCQALSSARVDNAAAVPARLFLYERQRHATFLDAKAGHPRTTRSLQRYFAKGHLAKHARPGQQAGGGPPP